MSDPTERRFYVAHKARKFGPLSLAELASRRLTDDMQAWHEHLPEWVPITEIAELRPYVRSAAATRTIDPPSQSWGGGPRPGPAPPLPTGGGVAPPPPVQPVGGRVKFLGVTSIVLASLGLLCCPVSLFGTWTSTIPTDTVNPFAIWLERTVTLSILLLVSIPMLAAGIGLVRGRRWARILGVISSLVCILTYFAMLVLDISFVYWPLLTAAGTPEADMPGGSAGLYAMISVGVFSPIAAMAWHVTTVALLNSATVRSSLR